MADENNMRIDVQATTDETGLILTHVVVETGEPLSHVIVDPAAAMRIGKRLVEWAGGRQAWSNAQTQASGSIEHVGTAAGGSKLPAADGGSSGRAG